MYLRQTCILIILCLSFTTAYAQKTKTKSDPPDNENLKMYLDDNRIGNVKNMLRFRFGTLPSGYLGLSYERRISRKLGLEVGGYYKAVNALVFNENARMVFSKEGSFGVQSSKGGFGVTVYPKFYLTGKSMNNGYFFGLRNAYYACNANVNGGRYTSDRLVPGRSISSVFMIGSHQQWGSRFAFGVEWGFGVAHETYKGVETGEFDYNTYTTVLSTRDIKSTNFILSLDMVFGFLF